MIFFCIAKVVLRQDDLMMPREKFKKQCNLVRFGVHFRQIFGLKMFL